MFVRHPYTRLQFEFARHGKSALPLLLCSAGNAALVLRPGIVGLGVLDFGVGCASGRYGDGIHFHRQRRFRALL